METFNRDYVDYWKKRVKNNVDGTKVADEDIADFYIGQMEIKTHDKVVDLGCNYGRLFDVIAKYCKNITGLDISYDAINSASVKPYSCLVKARAEETHLASSFYDKVIIWAVYDVVEQEAGLVEENRILKKGGNLLITGKNDNYRNEDKKAFIAERNAKLKGFPNHFTDVFKLINNSECFGFKVKAAYAFENRGDFGINKFIEIKKHDNFQFYEFLIILEKSEEAVKDSINFNICNEFSSIALKNSARAGFKNVIDYFEWHKEKFGDE